MHSVENELFDWQREVSPLQGNTDDKTRQVKDTSRLSGSSICIEDTHIVK